VIDPVETQLLEQARGGGTEAIDAFDTLHLRLQPVITRFVRRLIGGGDQVDDIVQDTFLSLYTNMDRIDPPENLRPYLFRIARNRSYDILRRQGRYEQLSLDDEPVSVRVSFDVAGQQAESKPEEAAHWILLNLEVQEAIDRLPENQRQALILFSEEQMSYSEIAEVMDVSIGTVKSRLFHAKKNLRGLVRPETLDAIQSTGINGTPREHTDSASSDSEASTDDADPEPGRAEPQQVQAEPKHVQGGAAAS